MAAHHPFTLQLVRLKPGQSWSPPRQNLVFLFARAGSGEYLDGPISYRLGGGDVLVWQCSRNDRIASVARNEFSFATFSALGEHLYPLLATDEVRLLHPLLTAFQAPHFYAAAQPAAVEWHQLVANAPAASDLEHRTQLLRVATSVLSREFRKLRLVRPEPGRNGVPLTRHFEQLSVEEIMRLTVGQLARRFELSPRHLNRLFKEHFGLPIGALRMEMRLLKVITLLRDPESKITYIAKQCGFNHLGLFNSCFRRRFGLTPGQWRRKQTSEDAPAMTSSNGLPGCRLRDVGLCPWVEMPGAAPAPAAEQACAAGAMPQQVEAAAQPMAAMAGN